MSERCTLNNSAFSESEKAKEPSYFYIENSVFYNEAFVLWPSIFQWKIDKIGKMLFKVLDFYLDDQLFDRVN